MSRQLSYNFRATEFRLHQQQLLTLVICWLWVHINDIHCPRFHYRLSAASPSDVTCPQLHCLWSIQHRPRLSLFHSNTNLACSALCGIHPTVILSNYCPNHRVLSRTTLFSRVAWLAACMTVLCPECLIHAHEFNSRRFSAIILVAMLLNGDIAPEVFKRYNTYTVYQRHTTFLG